MFSLNCDDNCECEVTTVWQRLIPRFQNTMRIYVWQDRTRGKHGGKESEIQSQDSGFDFLCLINPHIAILMF